MSERSDDIRLAIAQEQSGVTADSTSSLDRAANTGTAVTSVVGEYFDSTSKAFDNPLLKDAQGNPKPFSSLSTGDQVAVVTRTASNVAGAAMGAVGLVEDCLNVGFASLTAPIAAICPSLPAATLMTPYIGLPHGHKHPPSYIPAPPPGAVIPLPSFGTVMFGNHVKTLIGNLPAARCGDIGLAPTCLGFTPFFEITTGSSNVFIGGKRAARMLDVCVCCNEAESKGAKSKFDKAAEKAAKGMKAAGVAAQSLAIAADLAECAAEDDAAMSAAKGLSAGMGAADLAAEAIADGIRKLMGKDGAVIPGPGPTGAGPMKVMGALTIGNPTVLIGGFPMIETMAAAKMLLNKLKGLRRKKSSPDGEDDANANPKRC